MMSMGMPAFSSTFSTPMWAIPLAPPPLSTTATFFLSPLTSFFSPISCAVTVLQNSTATSIITIFFILLLDVQYDDGFRGHLNGDRVLLQFGVLEGLGGDDGGVLEVVEVGHRTRGDDEEGQNCSPHLDTHLRQVVAGFGVANEFLHGLVNGLRGLAGIAEVLLQQSLQAVVAELLLVDVLGSLMPSV